MLSVFLAHSKQDQPLAGELAEFLERGAGVRVFIEEGEIDPEATLLSKTQEGLMADVILVLLSPDSVPSRWAREEWGPVFWDQPKEQGVELATVLCRECRFPELLRKRRHFDLAHNRLEGFRAIKQWLLSLRPAAGEPAFVPARTVPFVGRETELEALRRALGDRPGRAVLTGPVAGAGKTTLALEFARRTQRDFEAICWAGCRRRSAAGIAGDLAAQLDLRLEGDLEANLAELRGFCAQRRLLVVLDDLEDDVLLDMIPAGKASVLITSRRRDLTGSVAGDFIDLAPLPGTHLIQEAIAAIGEQERRLLAAMGACAPGGFRLALAAEAAGLDARAASAALEGLLSRSVVLELNERGPRYFLPSLVRQAIEPAAHAHARTVCQQFARWSRNPSGCEADLPDLQQALIWALSREGDEETWTLACDLAWRGFAFSARERRVAEAFELMEQLSRAAEQRADRGTLERCSREQVWLLEGWGRHQEARRLDQHRRVNYQDQMCFDFGAD
jgi:hypothetical protein